MQYWGSGIVHDLLILALLLGAAMLLVRSVPRLRRLTVPHAILAGLLGLALGPSGAGLLPTDIEAMELIVYHAFAIMFIAVGLQAAPRARKPGAAMSIAVGNAFIGALQAILGLGFVALWLAVEPLHPGFGLMPTLGFQQGPGQALSIGGVWEQAGMTDGTQLGLIFATLGFLYCIGLGVPMVAIARRRGLIGPDDELEPARSVPTIAPSADEPTRSEPLSLQLVFVGCVYLAVFGVIMGIVALLPEGSKLAKTLWGLHFIVGSLLAIALRFFARRTGHDGPFRDDMLARISVIAVDITTAGAIAAVRLEVLGTWLVPILVITALTGGLTLVCCLWLARRAFPEAPFAHALVLFGMGTGTVSTGLALLRMLDPELRGAAARNAVIGATASIPFNAPILLGALTLAPGFWSDGTATALGAPLGMLVACLVWIVVSWRLFTPLRVLRPWRSLWPPDSG